MTNAQCARVAMHLLGALTKSVADADEARQVLQRALKALDAPCIMEDLQRDIQGEPTDVPR